ncbi:hypothetical protein [Halonatronum saccharophilum]|uniref:hypothetical protein n=1 Tax=Halonatronum saccharophilum TaxID=150060 RepID=UPI000481EC76|nr:hypothetical protein [Halonatronum saccharophilum]
MKRLIFALIIVLVIVPTALAGEFGDNGLIEGPTADILYSGEFNLHYQRVGNGDLILMEYGLREGVQIGARIALNNNTKLEPTLKVTLLDEDGGYKPELAFGLVDDSLYLVGSKATPYYGIRGHLGIIDRNKSLSEQFFVGATKVLNPVTISTTSNSYSIPRTTIIAEYNKGLNLGAKFNFNPHISANIGVKDLEDFTFGVGFKNYF